jgi:hypothetical protein
MAGRSAAWRGQASTPATIGYGISSVARPGQLLGQSSPIDLNPILRDQTVLDVIDDGADLPHHSAGSVVAANRCDMPSDLGQPRKRPRPVDKELINEKIKLAKGRGHVTDVIGIVVRAALDAAFVLGSHLVRQDHGRHELGRPLWLTARADVLQKIGNNPGGSPQGRSPSNSATTWLSAPTAGSLPADSDVATRDVAERDPQPLQPNILWRPNADCAPP